MAIAELQREEDKRKGENGIHLKELSAWDCREAKVKRMWLSGFHFYLTLGKIS